MRLKICGITRQEDAQAACRMGYEFCGFVFHRASPRFITPERAAALDSGSLLRVGVFVEQGAAQIRAIMRRARLDYAQLHGDQGLDVARAVGPHRVIRVVWPARHERLEDLEASPCAFYLLESGTAGGGSGRRMDWDRLAGIRLKPFFLAGGLGPDSVVDAARSCGPMGLDLNSGVEKAPGVKDHEKMAAVAAALRGM